MIMVWLMLLIGIAGGWEQGLIDTPTFLLLAGLTMILLIKEGVKLRGSESKR